MDTARRAKNQKDTIKRANDQKDTTDRANDQRNTAGDLMIRGTLQEI